MPKSPIFEFFAYLFLIEIKDTKAWLVLSNKMDTCYLLVDVQEIRIQPYFCIKQGDYFFSLFLGHPVYGFFYSKETRGVPFCTLLI